MYKIVNLSPFPNKRYEIIETIPTNQHCTITRCRNKAQDIEYFVYAYTIRSLPDRIKEKIINEIEEFSKYEENEEGRIAVANKAYIDVSEEATEISLRARCCKGKNLQQLLKSKSYTTVEELKIENMIKLSETLLNMHADRHPHGNITISNIRYKKSAKQFVLGTPVYWQIHKWMQLQAKSATQKQQIYRWERPTLPSDVFSLGKVFLQLWINQELPENITSSEIREHLSKIQHKGIQYILQQMLADTRKRWTLHQAYDNLYDLQQLKMPQPLPAIQPVYQQCRMCLSLFDSVENIGTLAWNNDGLVIEVFKNCNNWFGVFSFVKGKIFLKVIFKTGQGPSVFLDISEQVNKVKCRQKWHWLNADKMQEILKNPNTALQLTEQGSLEIKGYYLPSVQQAGQQKKDERPKYAQMNYQPDYPKIETPVSSFDKLCRIQGETVRMGLVISENLVLTSAWDPEQIRTNQDTLSFQTKEFKGGRPHQYDVWIASQETENRFPPNYDFSVITFKEDITLVCFSHYMKLVRNYSQQIIEEKLKREEENLPFSYQLGGEFFQKGEIVFDRERFICSGQKQKWAHFLSGQPLILILPSGSNTVIGLYDTDGRGILFTDYFYWTLYSIIVRSHGQSQVSKNQQLSFIFVQCMFLEVMEGDLPNLGLKWIKYFMLTQRTDENAILNDLHELEKHEIRNGKQIAFFNYILSLLHHNKVNNGLFDEMPMAINHMREAIESSFFFKGRDNFISALLQFRLAVMLLAISFDTEEGLLYLYAALSAFRNGAFNPFILINILRKSTSVPNHFDQEQIGQNMSEIISMQKMLGMVGSLKNLYTRALHTYQSANASFQQIQNIQCQLQSLTDYTFFKRKKYNYQKTIKRTQKSIKNQEFSLITSRLDELLARNRRTQNEARQEKLKGLWKSAITVFMQGCKDPDELKDFQQLTKKYYQQDGYLKVSETFREKERVLMAQQAQQPQFL